MKVSNPHVHCVPLLIRRKKDLYGDINDAALDEKAQEQFGPAAITLSPYDILTGVGKIMDIEFGIAASDQGVSLSLWNRLEGVAGLILCTVTHVSPIGSRQWWISQFNFQRLPCKSPLFSNTSAEVEFWLTQVDSEVSL